MGLLSITLHTPHSTPHHHLYSSSVPSQWQWWATVAKEDKYIGNVGELISLVHGNCRTKSGSGGCLVEGQVYYVLMFLKGSWWLGHMLEGKVDVAGCLMAHSWGPGGGKSGCWLLGCLFCVWGVTWKLCEDRHHDVLARSRRDLY